VEEEVAMATPCKTKKLMKGKGEVGPSKMLAQKKTHSLIVKSKGGIEVNVNLLVKRPSAMLKKNKGNEKGSQTKQRVDVCGLAFVRRVQHGW
jgi:hypothetical protein